MDDGTYEAFLARYTEPPSRDVIELKRLRQVNEALLEALEGVMDMLDGECPDHPITEKVRAAIKLAEGKE